MPITEPSELKIMPKSIVCEETTLQGDITISPGCVLHPKATIIAEAGPVFLGENCIVEEYARIIYRKNPNSTTPSPTMYIGSNNVFEVGCTVEAFHIGDKNVFEAKSFVGSGVSVSSGCIIGAGVQLRYSQNLPENTVIYGPDRQQREAIEKRGTQTLQIDLLRKVLPNYHHSRKANYDPKKARPGV